MRVKLIDIKIRDYETTFGTCELCFSYGTASEPTFIFQDENSNVREVNGYFWDWGDFYNVDVGNTLDFMIWFNDQKFEVDSLDNIDYSMIDNWNDMRLYGDDYS